MAPLCFAIAIATASLSAGAPTVLMVLTSNDKLGAKDEKGETGWYLPEAAHPFDVFKKAGVQMTWASPKGGKAPVDKSSVTAYAKDKEASAFLKEDAWQHTKALKDVDPADFDAVFVVGGYGVMWDLVKDDHMHEIAAKVYEDGGVVSGVCHGPAALVGVKLSDGKSLVSGKEVACFSNAEEDVMKRHDVVPETCEDAFKDAGAKYTKDKPWSDHVSVSGRLITGQNPMSAKSTAEAVVKAIKQRPSVLMVLTSNDKLGAKDKKGETGWYLPEAAHPFDVFKKAGVQMTWASPKGGKAPVDKGSVAAYKKDKEATAFLQEKAWKHTEALKDVDPSDFDAVFVVGGYGVMWDLVKDDHMHQIAAKVYEDGGIVSGVCHGPAALVGVKLSDGKSLVEGKKVACFSNAEEDALKRRDVVPKTCEDSFADAGAKYTKGKPWSDHVSVSGRLITGQNPMSAKSTAEAVVKALSREKVEEEKFQLGKVVPQPSGGLGFGAVFGVAFGALFSGMAMLAFRRRGQPRAMATEGSFQDVDILLEDQDFLE